jgi:pyruvate formate lyase activating enzyme
MREAMLYDKVRGDAVHCFLCAHHCNISPGEYGFCGVRQNIDGVLYSLTYGEIIAAHVDPIEKKPLYHFLPGTYAYSVAAIGCNFHCGFCQNWQISQVSKRDGGGRFGTPVSPGEVVKRAVSSDCASIAYTYTEPTIFFEYAYDTAALAHKAGLKNVFVTNGFMTEQAIEAILPYLDAANVDLKAFTDEFYRRACQGRLEPVKKSIQSMHAHGVSLEITTLVVPGENDSEDELRGIAEFIASVDTRIPWHISRFHGDYQYAGRSSTPIETLRKARSLGQEAGLRYIHLGNV